MIIEEYIAERERIVLAVEQRDGNAEADHCWETLEVVNGYIVQVLLNTRKMAELEPEIKAGLQRVSEKFHL